MICVVTMHRLHDQSFDEWRKSWETTDWPSPVVRAYALRGVDNPDDVMTIVFESHQATQQHVHGQAFHIVHDVRVRERRDGMAAFQAGVI
ncbi:MAG: hypothetical protein GEU74_08470 [Nitriliruptorales bacterium]|nr:hypothetical protein [Nitriliruptorales bacterium]